MSKKPTPWFVLHSPEVGRPFAEFCESCKNEGVLSKKTKEILMAALACAFRCPDCTQEHIIAAIEAGASKEELTEALLLAASVGAETQLAWDREAVKKLLT